MKKKRNNNDILAEDNGIEVIEENTEDIFEEVEEVIGEIGSDKAVKEIVDEGEECTAGPDIDELRSEIELLQRQRDDLNAEIEKLVIKRETAKQQLEGYQSQYNDAQEKIEQINKKFDEKKEAYQRLGLAYSDLQEELENYKSNFTRAKMDSLSGIFDNLSNECSFADVQQSNKELAREQYKAFSEIKASVENMYNTNNKVLLDNLMYSLKQTVGEISNAIQTQNEEAKREINDMISSKSATVCEDIRQIQSNFNTVNDSKIAKIAQSLELTIYKMVAADNEVLIPYINMLSTTLEFISESVIALSNIKEVIKPNPGDVFNPSMHAEYEPSETSSSNQPKIIETVYVSGYILANNTVMQAFVKLKD